MRITIGVPFLFAKVTIYKAFSMLFNNNRLCSCSEMSGHRACLHFAQNTFSWKVVWGAHWGRGIIKKWTQLLRFNGASFRATAWIWKFKGIAISRLLGRYSTNPYDERVNDSMPEEGLRIPYESIVYIGDRATDIPCVRLVKSKGDILSACLIP